jgi:hypothetical protein
MSLFCVEVTQNNDIDSPWRPTPALWTPMADDASALPLDTGDADGR